MIKFKLFKAQEADKPPLHLKYIRCFRCRKPFLLMTDDQKVAYLEWPKTGVPETASGLVVTCPCCGNMYMVTGLTDSLKATS